MSRSLAALWCAVYGSLSLAWAFGAPGFPLGVGDRRAVEMDHWLAHAEPGPTGAVLFVGCLVAFLAAVLPQRRASGVILLASAALIVVCVPDARVLQNLAYGLRGYFGLVDWPLLNQVFCLFGAALLGRAGFRSLHVDAASGTSARWLQIGRWATLVAVLAPLPYALQRAAWNLGVPLGVSEEFVDELAADLEAKGLSPLTAWSLVIPDVIGVLLTLGLVMRWGERLPAWVPSLGGRRVPALLAVVPATVVALAVSVAGLTVLRYAFTDGLTGAGVPGLLWLPWGVALGIATFAYYQRRRAAAQEPVPWPRDAKFV
ncbi:hypothetical protein [Cryptosporangium aurantiacum]|uniref:Uncharacterized protein n=1 Tax=Cryptosporangium aurantiacum TaxID=134849 RepID=A0A1M7R825_9ACTN|nr:hypothetical protein [Cryptosporangium aurantiacum]SHN42457.1 hypothetical protein SAMN05443668_108215 [Cryptosporangium aurantiacum]